MKIFLCFFVVLGCSISQRKQKACRVFPAVARLTVHRRLQVTFLCAGRQDFFGRKMINFGSQKFILSKIFYISNIPNHFYFNLLGMKDEPLKRDVSLCAGVCACIIQRSARKGAFFSFFVFCFFNFILKANTMKKKA